MLDELKAHMNEVIFSFRSSLVDGLCSQAKCEAIWRGTYMIGGKRLCSRWGLRKHEDR